MGDSLKLVEDGYIRRIHDSGKLSGKLHKGHSITAATASIPSKYQTIVTDNSERKGFASRAKRFGSEAVGSNPGPGTYVGHGGVDKVSPSYSKKGTGGFASKDRRLHKHGTTCGPGSGAYNLPGLLSSRKDFNRATSTSTFHKPIAQNIDDIAQKTPGANQYDVTTIVRATGKTNNVTANAAFKSQSKREAFDLSAKANPAPWQYHINEELVKSNVTVPCSSFKSKTVRQMAPDPDPVPGPGAYRPYSAIDQVEKTVFPRKHYLCISAPAMPLPSAAPQPGPGAYELVNFEGPAKHYMSGAVFVSSTSRWTTGQPRNAEFPGPAHYRPIGGAKQSFIYNAAGRWI